MGLGAYIRNGVLQWRRCAELFNIVAQFNVGTTGGAANAHTISAVGPVKSLTSGTVIRLIPGTKNTGATTLKYGSDSAGDILTPDGSALRGGELLTTGVYDLYYDGTDYILLTPVRADTTWTPTLGVNGGNFSSTTVVENDYAVKDGYVDLILEFTGTTGAGPNFLTFTPPVTPRVKNYTLPVMCDDPANGLNIGACYYDHSAGVFRVYSDVNFGGWTNGTATVFVNGRYRIL